MSGGLSLFQQPDELSSPVPDRLRSLVQRFQRWMSHPESPIRAIHHQPASEARWAALPDFLHADLKKALAETGISQLYSHQAASLELVRQGHNVAVVTPTASGKTLCYNLPVLQAILENPATCAIYVFPTKALAEDQLHHLHQLIHRAGAQIRAHTFDGDTPQDARKAIRQRANIVLTNPEMLHSGILPHHTRWARVFENLRFVVIDELHSYRGVYGSHFANVLRRLRRICRFYGSQPQFICCSATIANPKEHAEALLELPVEVIAESGAPRGEKYFVFYNPPVVNPELGIRRSYLNETRRITIELTKHGLQTLVFANNRLAMEVLLTYLKQHYEHTTEGPNSVRGYRGGYLPRERREVEGKLRQGELRAVVATNALELGVDIGGLDAVVLAGYPGTIASTWQRAGRAGRRDTPALAILVASSAPLDQYIVEHPQYFFGASPEHAYINPNNLEILLSHLKCAAFELPLEEGEQFGPQPLKPLASFLEELGFLHYNAGKWHWIGDTYPADAVSLRSITSDNFVVIDITSHPMVIGEVAFSNALTELHEKAIYLHEGKQYQVESFDYDGRKAYVRRVECDYFTDAIDYSKVTVLEEAESVPLGPIKAAHGDVRVNRQIVGFKKVRFYTLENVGSGNLSLPEQEMHTTAFWLHFPAEFLSALTEFNPAERQQGLIGLANVLRTIAALLVMCDPRDLGISLGEDSTASGVFAPNLYLYDKYPGGVGQSALLFKLKAELLAKAKELLDSCRCEMGCPSCVGPVGEVGERGKEVAQTVLRTILEALKYHRPSQLNNQEQTTGATS